MAVLKITKDNFEKEVLKSDVPVLVDFFATWCGPCQALGPVIEEAETQVTNAKIGKINIDEEPELARKFSVMSVPTLIVFKDGEVDRKEVGGRSLSDLLDMLK